MLEELTKKQEALFDKVFAEYDAIPDKPKKATVAAVRPWLDVVYAEYKIARPSRIEIVGSPEAAFALEKELTGSTQRTLDWCGIADAGWVSFYDYFHRIKVLTDEEMSEALALRAFMRCCYDSVLLDECAIVIQMPVCRRDQDGALHSSRSKPAVEWADGSRFWAWHGVWVPERIVIEPKSYTREEYLGITSTEVRRALAECAGGDFVTGLLGAKVTDSWKDKSTSLKYELLTCDNGERFLRKLSPKLQNGSQPSYTEPVHEELRTAQAARKWQAVNWSPARCESDPVLIYGVEA